MTDQTYWILEERQLRVMASPRRHDIVDRLVASGPMSIKKLAQQIGAQPSALYHHIARLQEVGLVLEAGTQMVGRRREQLYKTPAPRMRLARAVSENKHPEILAEIVSALTRQMARDFQSGLDLPMTKAEGEERNLGFGRIVGRPSPAHLARVNACLAEISEILWESGKNDMPLLTFGFVLSPIDDAAGDGRA